MLQDCYFLTPYVYFTLLHTEGYVNVPPEYDDVCVTVILWSVSFILTACLSTCMCGCFLQRIHFALPDDTEVDIKNLLLVCVSHVVPLREKTVTLWSRAVTLTCAVEIFCL